jgi:hypothetical protein
MPVLRRGNRQEVSEYDAVACLRWWRERKLKTAETEKARKDRSIADINELRKAEMERRLVSRDQVEREGEAALRAVADGVRDFSRRLVLAGLIVSRDRQPEVDAMGDELLDRLTEWSKSLRRR